MLIGALAASGLAPVQSSLHALSSHVLSDANAIDPKSGYIPWRQVGILRKGKTSCPPVHGWQIEPALAQDNPFNVLTLPRIPAKAAANRALIHKVGLDRFCTYNRPLQSNEPFVRPADLLTAKPDRMAIATFGQDQPQVPSAPPAAPFASILADEFKNQTGRVPFRFAASNTPDVQLTFIDSQPDQNSLSSSAPLSGSQHGYAMGQLARELVCDDDGQCAATITSLRALNYGDPKQLSIPLPADSGGRVGTIADIALKIEQAVSDFNLSGSSQHLILNLSIGWDGETPLDGLRTDIDARTVSQLEPSVQRVYAALQFAAQSDVLVIAAAGNRRGGSLHDSRWPVLPAAWELRHPSSPPLHSKLVYAVGGVDWQGLPLSNSRTRGLPRLVAYGDHAAAIEGKTVTGVFTGTSVSAAVVSSIAAVVWHLRPGLRPAGVMRLLDRSADGQEAHADFYVRRPHHPAPRLREVSLCAAIERACGSGARPCSALTIASAAQCKPLVHQPPVLPSLIGGTEAAYHVTGPQPLNAVCHPRARLMTADDAVPTDICPTDEYRSVLSQRWVLPQPGDNPCPSCSIIPPGGGPAAFHAASSSIPQSEKRYNLVIEISQEWIASVGNLESATLDIDRFKHGVLVKRMTYPIFVRGQAIPNIMTNLGDGHGLEGCRAQLNFVVKRGSEPPMSIQSPVLLDP